MEKLLSFDNILQSASNLPSESLCKEKYTYAITFYFSIRDSNQNDLGKTGVEE